MESKTNNALIGACTFAVIVSMLSVPNVAFAAETGGVSAILPDMVEFIPMLVAFIILWIVLAKFGWPAFSGVLEKRSQKIRDDLAAAEQAKIESQRLLDEYRAQMEDAKRQATDIIAEAKKTGETVKADLTAQAQAESEKMIEKATAAIEAEKKAAVAELQSSVADISVNVAGKIIGSDLSDAEHRKIIEKYVEQAGSLNAD